MQVGESDPRHIVNRRVRRNIRIALALWPLLWTVTPVHPADDEPLDFGFAAYLGSGLYRSSGKTLQALKLPFYWTLREQRPDRWGLKVNFPFTVGIVNPDDPLLDPFLLGRVDAFSIVPGVEFSVALRSRTHPTINRAP